MLAVGGRTPDQSSAPSRSKYMVIDLRRRRRLRVAATGEDHRDERRRDDRPRSHGSTVKLTAFHIPAIGVFPFHALIPTLY